MTTDSFLSFFIALTFSFPSLTGSIETCENTAECTVEVYCSAEHLEKVKLSFQITDVKSF